MQLHQKSFNFGTEFAIMIYLEIYNALHLSITVYSMIEGIIPKRLGLPL